jgi:hypothetical protein
MPDTMPFEKVPARYLDHSSESKDHLWLRQLERDARQLSDPDEPDLPEPAEASDFEPLILTEEQEDALAEYGDAKDTITNVYDEFQSATDSLKSAYETVVEAFGFKPQS